MTSLPTDVEDNPITRNSAYGLCVGHRGALLIRIGEGFTEGEWTVTGGQIEWGEQPEQTVRRELLEETGLRIELGKLLGVLSHAFMRSEARPFDSTHCICLYYAVARVEGHLRAEEGTKDHVAWVPLDRIAGLRKSPFLDFASRYGVGAV